MTGRHPELDSEQRYIDGAYRCLESSRRRAAGLASAIEAGPGGAHQTRLEREALIEGALSRLGRLSTGDRSLVFGRLDPAGAGERLYVGRVGLWDDEKEPVVMDWRAPAAEPFYRATAAEPLGLERRRRFASRGPKLLGIEEEVFGPAPSGGAPGGEGAPDGEGEASAGRGALMAALGAPRTGRLGDAVATIQREQDEVIRSEMPGVLVVEGGPGTGKTVVALHRAAYLLYTHRFPLEGQGVLVVGPNRLFLAYVEQVLPSLGEAGVELAVLADLLSPAVRVDGLDPEPVAGVKGDPRMAAVVARAVRDRQRPLRRDLVVGLGVQRVRVTVEESARIVAEARRRSRRHNSGRKVVEAEFFAALGAAARRPVGPAAVREHLRDTLEVREALEWMWPVLSPAHLLHDLFGSAALLRSASGGRLTPDEVELLHRPRSPHADEVVWSFQDVPLLDEARARLGRRPSHGASDEVRTYGHICVDEAQDLSPMELRMISRRSLNGSLTVVGDVAQGTGSWAHDDWGSVLEQLPARRPPRCARLTIGYRIPAPAMALANRVRAHAAPGIRAPQTFVRTEGDDPVVVCAGGDLAGALAEVVSAERASVGEGNVAVIVPDSLYDPVRSALQEAGVDFGGPTRSGLDRQVTVVPVRLVKGLEVDSAVVVEPARIAAEERQGVRSLYVALTRATKRVAVVHDDPLPEALRADPAPEDSGEAGPEDSTESAELAESGKSAGPDVSAESTESAGPAESVA